MEEAFPEGAVCEEYCERGSISKLGGPLSWDMSEVSKEELEKAVRKLQNKKAAGDDRIVAELLKKGGEAVIEWLMKHPAITLCLLHLRLQYLGSFVEAKVV